MIADFIAEMRQGTNVTPIIVTPETDLLNDIGIDSLEMTELVYRLQDVTGLYFDLDRLELIHFRCVRELAKLIDEMRR